MNTAAVSAAFLYFRKNESMLTKQQVLDAIKEMPETFDTSELFERILLLKKIEEGRQQAREGNTYSMEEAKEKLQKWLK
jgi:hypothetical protein